MLALHTLPRVSSVTFHLHRIKIQHFELGMCFKRVMCLNLTINLISYSMHTCACMSSLNTIKISCH